MAVKLRTSPYATTDANTVRTLMRRTGMSRSPMRRPVAQPVGEAQVQAKLLHDTISRRAGYEVLARTAFLRELEREKRRADRSRTPLSVVRLHVRADANLEKSALRLLDVVNASRRETDIVGQLGEGVVGALLPATSETGAGVFVRKVSQRMGDVAVSTTVTTYPDAAFGSVANGEAVADEAAAFADEPVAVRNWAGDATKRAIDIVFSLALLVMLAPLMIGIALAISITSRGPVIFRQSRLGKGGRPFQFYKFRSMLTSNDDRIHREFVSSLIKGQHDQLAGMNAQASAEPMFKIRNDPRVTPIGRFIRATSIDELPQLFNVLKGDMSLVGPRPPLPYEAEQYQSWHLRRILEIRPGITGLWQVEGRSRVSFDEMVRMDLRYIKQRSLLLDFKLLFRTIAVVVDRRGGK